MYFLDIENYTFNQNSRNNSAFKYMKREIIVTKDGSTTIYFPEINETYHSKFGAILESNHVFIEMGLKLFLNKSHISLLEIGFGTGLNALLTILDIKKTKQSIDYVGVEAYPVPQSEILQMNFTEVLNNKEVETVFKKMHSCDWNKKIELTKNFSITKRHQFFQEINDVNAYDLIYFDAFGYRIEPELWSKEIFEKMYNALKINGLLVTYACRSSIKNDMIAIGFKVEKLPGAPGKREMLRATKI